LKSSGIFPGGDPFIRDKGERKGEVAGSLKARLLKASEIRRFFIKHQSHLRHEIEQLRKHIRQGVSS